ncbi:hypothetical protein FHY55_18945 [Oceanicola sp. D3]|uniref:hypothetical protein n=1 Tax=Oceanicola sp. D3 TaxID=2587163 RepID=UPI00111FF777|nr:hypothetical protein [Oceanicola sp. D3]QDC11181.1 hypothetical protein FHY55_18945 [Oceanicola sp. D3]
MAESAIIFYLHGHDVPGAGVTFSIDKDPPAGWSVLHWTIEKSMTAKELAEKIVAHCTKEGAKIGGIVINSHGAPAEIKLGKKISFSTVDDLAPLKGNFAKRHNGIDAHCCNVAAAGIKLDVREVESTYGTTAALGYSLFNDTGIEKKGVGHQFMVKMAKATGVHVNAPYQIQMAAIEVGGFVVKRPTGHFAGRWVRAWPDGVSKSFSEHIKPR